MVKSLLYAGLPLVILIIAACGQKAPATAAEGSAPASGLKIAYVDGDTVLMNFKAFRDASDKLDARQRELEAELQKKGEALEREIMGYQQQAQSGTLTPKQMQEKERYLAGRQDAVLKERDRLAKEMMNESSVINEQLKKILEEKLEKLRVRDGYDYILSKVEGGPILLADKKHDITREVLTLLNEDHAEISADTTAKK